MTKLAIVFCRYFQLEIVKIVYIYKVYFAMNKSFFILWLYLCKILITRWLSLKHRYVNHLGNRVCLN